MNGVQGKKNIKLVSIFICIFLFLIPFDTLEIFSDFSILKFFAIVLTITSLFYQKKSKVHLCRTLAVLFVFCFYIILQLLYSEYFSSVLNTLITILLYTVMITLLAQIPYNKEEKELFVKSLCYMSILCVLLTLVIPYRFEGRLTICFPGMRREDPNQFAGYLMPGVLYFLNRVLTKQKYIIPSLLLTLLLMYFILLTGSRGALIAIVLGLISLISIRSGFFQKNWFTGLIKIVVIVLLLLIVYELIINLLPAELAERFDLLDAVSSGGSGRGDIWKFYLDYYNESEPFFKIFGVGAGSIKSIYRMVAHNTWLEMLVCTGLVGSTIFLLFNISVLKNFVKEKNYLLLSIFIATLGLTLSLSLLSYKLLWAIVLLSVIFISNNEIIRKDMKILAEGEKDE